MPATSALRTLLVNMALFVTIVGFASPAQAASLGSFSAFFPPLVWSPHWWRQALATPPSPSPTIVPSSPAAPTPPTLTSLTPTPPPTESLTSFIQEAQAMDSPAQTPTNRKVVAGWLTSWDEASFQSFKNNLDTLTEVHPFVYTIGADGISLIPDDGDWHKDEVMRLARQHSIKVVPTISGDVNYSDLMLNDPAKRTAHIDEIVKAIHDNSYDGFDIDYEGFLNGYNRDVYAAFMAELAERLHADNKIVAIAIEAFNRQQNWEALGAVVDRFMIMGYDYHSARGPEVGPIGPAGWLREVIDYAATRVPREKIVLGLGTYGYSWIHNGAQFVSEAVGYHDALAIAAEMGATIARQDDAPYFTYDRGAGQRYLYFEDAASTNPKLDVANHTNIAGIAFWRLGTEDPAIWRAVSEKMN